MYIRIRQLTRPQAENTIIQPCAVCGLMCARVPSASQPRSARRQPLQRADVIRIWYQLIAVKHIRTASSYNERPDDYCASTRTLRPRPLCFIFVSTHIWEPYCACTKWAFCVRISRAVRCWHQGQQRINRRDAVWTIPPPAENAG